MVPYNLHIKNLFVSDTLKYFQIYFCSKYHILNMHYTNQIWISRIRKNYSFLQEGEGKLRIYWYTIQSIMVFIATVFIAKFAPSRFLWPLNILQSYIYCRECDKANCNENVTAWRSDANLAMIFHN